MPLIKNRLPKGSILVTKLARVAVASAAAACVFGSSPGLTASARADNGTAGTCGYVLLPGSNWLGGRGVDVHLNTGGPTQSCAGYVHNLTANPPQWGNGWQCVELINRLYLTRGWITTTWYGNGHQMYDNAPANLKQNEQLEGKVSYLAPGDVIVFNTSFFASYGHVGIVESFSGTAGTMVSQNVGNDFRWSISLSAGTITVPKHAVASQIKGVVHAPTAQHASVALIPNHGGSGYRVDGNGYLHPFGNAPQVTSPSSVWPGLDMVRGIALFADSTTSAVRGYVLDGWGGVHPFAAGNANPPPTPAISAYWKGWDIARGIVIRGNTGSGYVLDGWGGIHPFGGAPAVSASAYWPGWDIARGIVLASSISGYVVDGWGGLHPFGGAARVSNPNYWPSWDIVRGIALASPTSGYLLDGWGGIHAFGGAPAVSGAGYSPNNDIFRGIAFDPTTHSGIDVTGNRGTSAGTAYPFHT